MGKYKLNEVCQIVTGTTPKTNIPEYWDGDLKWITPAELNDKSYIIEDTERKITELGANKAHLSPFPKGTVLLSSRAPIGKVAIAGDEMYCNQGFKNLICTEKINNEYLFWFLKGKKEYLNSLGRGATFKEISAKIVGAIEIELPSVEEQLGIVYKIKKCNEIIHNYESELELLDELVKARFVEMFGNTSNNEKGWKLIELGEIAPLITYGLTVRPEYIKDGYDLVSARELRKGYIEFDVAPKISKDDYKKLSEKGKPIKNDILFSKTGSIGHCAIVDEDREFAITQNAARIQCAHNGFIPQWVLYYLRTEYIQHWCQRRAKGNAVKDFQLQDMKKIPVFVTPKELQKQYVEFVEEVDKSREIVKKKLEIYQELFDKLMQEYFG